MKRFLRGSCAGLLIMICGIVAVISVLAILFLQSQAVSSNVSATAQPRATIARPNPPRPTLGAVFTPSPDEVTIRIDTAIPTNTTAPADTPIPSSLPSVTAADALPADLTSTAIPRYSGTSSYPLTVTAEVMLGLTHVAGYQASVGATRTAIAAESASIYATLTALAPTPTEVSP